jgi:hypothetical protein
MPLSWLANAWGCNPWQTDDGRSAAADTETFSVLPPLTQEQVDASSASADNADPGSFSSISPGEWAQSFRDNWPDVPPFIPESDRINEADDSATVLTWANSFRSEENKRYSPQCFDYAAYQVKQAGYGVSGPAHKSPTTHAVVVEYPDGKGFRKEVLEEEMISALVELKDYLSQHIPVQIGVQLTNWDKRPNNYKATNYVEPTNHYVVAIGMGKDDEGCYISYLDYMHPYSESDRLYLRDDLTMTSKGGWRLLTEVRRSTKY